MDELEKLYDELPYFDKQRFLKKHLGDVKPEDLDEFLIHKMTISWLKL